MVGTYQIIEIGYKAFSTQIILAQFCGTFPADFRCHFVCLLQKKRMDLGRIEAETTGQKQASSCLFSAWRV